ncbi:hypothetical protein [Nocardia arthritidis]|uniref:hypothetical protein n=1 Tax=Nocardia arthritidis TaxID=228602 RepID=UPI000B3097C3|nr:hypothetical protein [Nocardia arthritidis]
MTSIRVLSGNADTHGDVAGRQAVIVDDMISTAATIEAAITLPTSSSRPRTDR